VLEDDHTSTLIRAAIQAYPATDAELGNAIRTMSDRAVHQITIIGEAMINAEDKTFLKSFFTTLLPEISARLMLRDGIHIGMRRCADMRDLSDADLRAEFAIVFQSGALDRLRNALAASYRPNNTVSDIDVLVSPATNGNIPLLGLDRLCPPDMAYDPLGQMIKTAAFCRGVATSDGMWNPEMARYQLEDFATYADAARLQRHLVGDDILEEIDASPEISVAI
jgi:hypothetical protein